MKTYIFRTTTTMKEYNCKKWWIDPNIVGEVRINAENVRKALKQFQTIVSEKFYLSISDNALKNKNPMFVDTENGEPKQVGYVITGKYDFQDDFYRWSEQYIDLWVTIITIVDTEF